jgi:MoaA/NifB/PqqE/SkfB family radical SAM enzyme
MNTTRFADEKRWGAVILNPGCSNRCVFCSPQVRREDSEIRSQEIGVLKNLLQFKKIGINAIEISGSDPIEYDKIIPLIKYIKKLGFGFVQLSTHGRKLSDESFLDELIASGVDRLRIPLYGANAKVHDSVTRVRGSFNETLKGIKDVLNKSKSIEIQISCLIVEQNKDGLVDLVDFVRKLGIGDFYFSIPCVSNNDYSYYIPLKDLVPYVKGVYNHALKINYKINFMEIPHCVFGFFDNSINNSCLPPNLGKYCQPSKEHRSPKKDLPSYRIKSKVGICDNCKCSNFCDGFFVKDVGKWGAGNLKPIRIKSS